MNIYQDYANWKKENYKLISSLVIEKSKIISRFTHVIAVAEYLYNRHLKTNKDLITDEEVIFSTAFNYLYDHFNTINILLDKTFNKNLNELEALAKTINLLLYINDFQNELLNHELNNGVDIKKLDNLEQKVFQLLEEKSQAPDTLFGLLNDITSKIFESNQIEYYAINEIMYDIALEYGLIDENSDNDPLYHFNKIFINPDN